jgi:predicted nucleotidyltransferase
MSAQPADDFVLKRFRAALDEAYGDRIERVVLFGSRARGDAREDSDYDVAVFLRDMPDRFAEMNRLADLCTDILEETGAVIHALPCPAGSYEDRTSLMREIRYEGVDL